MCVTGIILAAGRGSRMGSPKQLLRLGGRPLLQHVVDAAAGELDDVILVLGHEAEAVLAALDLPAWVRVVVNPDHAEGQSTSLRTGLDHAPEGARAVVVLLGDQPEIRADAIRAVVEAQAAGDAPILRAAYRGRASHPVVLAREVWPGAEALRGDAGARALIAAHAGRVELVEVGGDPPEDIDTPEDLSRLVAARAATDAVESGGAGRDSRTDGDEPRSFEHA
jgi:CTP:molybdopterin cytidylyltransferase MocA